MLRLPRGKMTDLLATRHTRYNHGRVLSSRLDSRKETQGSHGLRNLIMLLLEAKRTRHSATAGIDKLHIIAGHELESVDSRFAARESLLVTVRVEDQPVRSVFSKYRPDRRFFRRQPAD